jgi:hypothetical protein
MRIALSIFALIALSLPAAAQPAVPTADEIMKVLNYYNDGTDQGPILVEATLCGEKIDRKTKQCAAPVAGSAEKGKTVELLMRWFVPKTGKYDDIRIEWIHNGEVRRTSDLKLTGSMNYRTWKAKTLGKAGDWEVRIRRGENQMKSIKVSVAE